MPLKEANYIHVNAAIRLELSSIPPVGSLQLTYHMVVTLTKFGRDVGVGWAAGVGGWGGVGMRTSNPLWMPLAIACSQRTL